MNPGLSWVDALIHEFVAKVPELDVINVTPSPDRTHATVTLWGGGHRTTFTVTLQPPKVPA